MSRLQAFIQMLSGKNVDGCFISSVANITYLTGFTGDSSRLLVSRKGCYLITDGRYTEQASNECSSEVEVFKWIDNKRYGKETYWHLVKMLDIQNLGFEAQVLVVSEYEVLKNGLPNVTLTDIQGCVEELRQQKDTNEIEHLRKACQITDRALEQTLTYIKEGVTELELTARLEFNLKMNGAENLSFDTMVLSGSKTSLLHGKPDGKTFQEGDFILFDFGALYKGYHADVSRTIVLGEASPKQKELYSVVLSAQLAAIQALKPGIHVREVDNAVKNEIPALYMEYYYPGLGHGVGLQIHESPFLGQAYDYWLQENMVVTIEPGIYIPGWGGLRIEDTVVIMKNSIEPLSRFPKELTELK